MIEGFAGRMTRQILRDIRVKSKQELAERIYKYFDEVNETSVVFHWRYKMDEFELSAIQKKQSNWCSRLIYELLEKIV